MTTTTLVPVSQRLDVDALVPEFSRAVSALDDAATAEADRAGIDPLLRELVRLRASQLNGCAYCVDTHSADARTGGESERRLYALPVWSQTPFFTERERAALALTEAMTRLTDGPVPDAVFAKAQAEFDDTELAELVWSITVINAWNRVAVTTHAWPLS
jgi:AhpD family alkylhydroperoxidase